MPLLEFAAEPGWVETMGRAGLRAAGLRAGRAYPMEIAWHDTPDGLVAARGMALSAAGGRWHLVPLRPAAATAVSPGQAARRPELLPDTPAASGLVRRAGFTGRRRTLRWACAPHAVTLEVLDGRFDQAGPGAPGVCRVTLEGAASALPAACIALARDAGLTVPRWGFAEQALHTPPAEPPPRALGPPRVQHGAPAGDSLALIAQHLLDVMVHWAALIPATRTEEPVHQMRVATRRLRSALSIFRRAAASPDLAALSVGLRLCAGRLGAARDWDVFLGGLGKRLAETFPQDRRCATMLRAASARRRHAYAALRLYLAGPDFRMLTAALAAAATLRPWDDPGEDAGPQQELAQDTAAFARAVLAKRMKRVRRAGRGIETLPIPALHELRKDCKRLRYAAEFFSPLFPHKKVRLFTSRLADLQEELGLLNDGAAASGLMAQLGRLERSYAAGLVDGFSAAHAQPARARILHGWKRFRRAAPFWS